ncbi:MAG: hypoxanthine phosphoribosyltransferase [Bacteroidota bacterium]
MPGITIVVKLHDKYFESYIGSFDLQLRVKELGAQINDEYANQELYLLIVLSGAFRFAADLSAQLHQNTEIGFIKLHSYSGTESTGLVTAQLPPSEDIRGKHVLIVEDIVDTGTTIEYLMGLEGIQAAKSVKIASLLFKPEADKKDFPVHYIGFEIPNLFVVGYGLDYNGLGRNLNDIYQLK